MRQDDARSKKLLACARDQSCVRCGRCDGSVVACHLTGVRRLAFGGGLGTKVHPPVVAHLCSRCHLDMDQLSRNKDERWLHSEEFEYLCLKTIVRLYEQGILKCAS